MYKLKLTKGRSYTGIVKATADKPFAEVDSKEKADALILTGRFILVESPEPADGDGGKGADSDEIPVDKMTEKQLEVYAAEKGIDLTGLKNKTDKLAKIQQVITESGNGVDFGENE